MSRGQDADRARQELEAQIEAQRGAGDNCHLSLTLSGVGSLEVVAALEWVESLTLSAGVLPDLSPLASLPRLQALDLEGVARVQDLSGLEGAASLRSLALPRNSAVSLGALERLPGLRSLTLSRGLEELAGLELRLEALTVRSASVADLSPVSRMRALQRLAVGDRRSAVSDLRPLSGLGLLTALELEAGGVEEVTALASLSRLATLRLSGHRRLRSLSGLERLARLEVLDLSQTSVEDLEPLRGLCALRTLSLRDTRARALWPLAGASALESLDLGRLRRLEGLELLASLPSLRHLDLEQTGLDPDSLDLPAHVQVDGAAPSPPPRRAPAAPAPVAPAPIAPAPVAPTPVAPRLTPRVAPRPAPKPEPVYLAPEPEPEPEPEPVVELEPEPVVEPEPEPEPVLASASEPEVEVEPAPEPGPEPVVASVEESVEEVTSEPELAPRSDVNGSNLLHFPASVARVVEEEEGTREGPFGASSGGLWVRGVSVQDVALSPSGARVAVAMTGAGASVQVFRLSDGALEASFGRGRGGVSVVFVGEEEVLFVDRRFSIAWEAVLWSAKLGEEASLVASLPGPPRRLLRAERGRVLVQGGAPLVWDGARLVECVEVAVEGGAEGARGGWELSPGERWVARSGAAEVEGPETGAREVSWWVVASSWPETARAAAAAVDYERGEHRIAWCDIVSV